MFIDAAKEFLSLLHTGTRISSGTPMCLMFFLGRWIWVGKERDRAGVRSILLGLHDIADPRRLAGRTSRWRSCSWRLSAGDVAQVSLRQIIGFVLPFWITRFLIESLDFRSRHTLWRVCHSHWHSLCHLRVHLSQRLSNVFCHSTVLMPMAARMNVWLLIALRVISGMGGVSNRLLHWHAEHFICGLVLLVGCRPTCNHDGLCFAWFSMCV